MSFLEDKQQYFYKNIAKFSILPQNFPLFLFLLLFLCQKKCINANAR